MKIIRAKDEINKPLQGALLSPNERTAIREELADRENEKKEAFKRRLKNLSDRELKELLNS